MRGAFLATAQKATGFLLFFACTATRCATLPTLDDTFSNFTDTGRYSGYSSDCNSRVRCQIQQLPQISDSFPVSISLPISDLCETHSSDLQPNSLLACKANRESHNIDLKCIMYKQTHTHTHTLSLSPSLMESPHSHCLCDKEGCRPCYLHLPIRPKCAPPSYPRKCLTGPH